MTWGIVGAIVAILSALAVWARRRVDRDPWIEVDMLPGPADSGPDPIIDREHDRDRAVIIDRVLGSEDPSDSDVEALIRRSKARAKWPSVLPVIMMLFGGDAMAETYTSSASYTLRTPLEKELWSVAVREEARADLLELDLRDSRTRLAKCQAAPPRIVRVPVQVQSEPNFWMSYLIPAIIGGVVVGGVFAIRQ